PREARRLAQLSDGRLVHGDATSFHELQFQRRRIDYRLRGRPVALAVRAGDVHLHARRTGVHAGRTRRARRTWWSGPRRAARVFRGRFVERRRAVRGAVGHRGCVRAEQQQRGQAGDTPEARRSPDGRWEAYIDNYNLYVRPATLAREAAPPPAGAVPGGGRGGRPAEPPGTELTYDGSEGGAYTLQSVVWSPDSRKIAVDRVTPGYQRFVHYVVSSPADQLQPEQMQRFYEKPGDVLEKREPVLV